MTTLTGGVIRRGFAVLGVAVRAQWRIFSLAVTGSMLYSAAIVLGAFAIGWASGDVVVPALESGHVAKGSLALAALALLAVGLAKVIGIIARRIAGGVMQYRMQATYRRALGRRYLELPMSWHARHPAGSLLSRASSDTEAAWFPIAPLPFAVGSATMLVTITFALLFTDVALALVGLVVFPTIFVLNVVYSRAMSPRMTLAQQLRGDVASVALESLDGAAVVKTLGREDAELARFTAQSATLRDSLIRVGRLRGLLDPLMEAIPTLGTLAVLLTGAWRVKGGQTDLADLISVAYLFTVMAMPVRAIGWVLGEMPRSVVGWGRIREVLDATEHDSFGTRTLPHDGAAAVTTEGVTFAYGSAPVLQEVSLHARPGEVLAVVGPTGAGKSTLLSLIARLFDPSAGIVRLDGVDVRDLTDGETSRHVALVAQTAFLFDDTVRANVTLGDDAFSDADVWAALELAQATRFVQALPAGLDTRLGERGATLSGGQRQRLALARALVRQPRLLLLDDATSAVDPRVEAAILAGLRDRGVLSTVIVVAYRRATITLADEVAYLHHGRIEASGTHHQLLAELAGYRDLVTAYDISAEPIEDISAEPIAMESS